MKIKTLLALTPFALLAGCGAGLDCGDGTFKHGDKCIAFDPDDETPPTTTLDPPGGKTRNRTPSYATLTSDEPALIYWSIDGSEPDPEVDEGHPSPALVVNLVEEATVTWFAVDPAGNREETRTSTFVYDPNPPGTVGLTLAVVGGSNAQLTWTNPADEDFTGTILARVTGPLDFYPEPDVFYTPGVLSSSVEIVQVGTGTSFTDSNVAPGDLHYIAWTFDDIANYSTPESVRGLAIGSTAGTLSIDVDTNTVTVLTQPANLVLSGTSSFSAGTLTLNLTVENQTTHYFQNPKILVTSLSAGTFSNSDGSISGQGTKYFGPEHMGPGSVETRTLTFTGVLLSDTVVVGVSVIEHPFLAAAGIRTNPQSSFLNDSRFGGSLGNGSFGVGDHDGPSASRGNARPGCASADGRYFYVGHQHYGGIDRIDLLTRTISGSIEFPQARMNSSLACDPASTSLFALIDGSGKRGGGNFSHSLIKLAPDLTELGRIDFDASATQGMYPIAVSNGGRYVAISFGLDEVHIVDTLLWTLVDTDPTTPEQDDVDISSLPNFGRGLRTMTWAKDGRTLYGLTWRGSGLNRILMPNGPAGGEITMDSFSVSCCPREGEIEIGSDGRVWIATDSGLQVFDPVQEMLSTTPYGMGTRGLEFINGELYVQRSDRMTVDVVNPATGAVIGGRTITLGTSNYFHGLRSSKTN